MTLGCSAIEGWCLVFQICRTAITTQPASVTLTRMIAIRFTGISTIGLALSTAIGSIRSGAGAAISGLKGSGLSEIFGFSSTGGAPVFNGEPHFIQTFTSRGFLYPHVAQD